MVENDFKVFMTSKLGNNFVLNVISSENQLVAGTSRPMPYLYMYKLVSKRDDRLV